MRTTGIAIGVLLVLAGGVWVLQGLGVAFAPQSFMTSDLAWAWIGGVTLLAGAGLVTWNARRRQPPR